MMDELLSAFIGLVFGGGGAWGVSRFAARYGLIDLPNVRSSHTLPTPRGGGVGLLITFLVVSVWYKMPVIFCLSGAILSLVSFWDDILGLSSKRKLLIQFVLAFLFLMAFYSTKQLSISLLLFPFWLFFIVGTANFYNFMDGINGIAGMSGVVGFGLVALFVWQESLPSEWLLMSASLAFSCLGFLPFNFPRAKVFMGDVGSVLLGFVFACLVFYCSSDLSIFLCLATFLFPFYADTLTTLYIRWRDGERILQAHRHHLYQLLCNEIGFPHWQVTCVFGLVQLSAGVLMLFSYQFGIMWQVSVVFVISFLFLLATFKVRRVVGCP